MILPNILWVYWHLNFIKCFAFSVFMMWRFHLCNPSYFFCFFPSQVDDILETKLDRKFKIITDKGTLDAIGLHPDGRAKRYNCDLETQREFWAHLRLIQLIPFLMGLGRIKTCKVNPLQSSSIPTKPNKPLVVNVVGTRNN